MVYHYCVRLHIPPRRITRIKLDGGTEKDSQPQSSMQSSITKFYDGTLKVPEITTEKAMIEGRDEIINETIRVFKEEVGVDAAPNYITVMSLTPLGGFGKVD